MKRKFVSVLLALVLVVSFSLVTATPAAATTFNVIPFILQTGTNAASWSDVQKSSGSYSALLNYVSGDDSSYVEFIPPAGTTVNDLATISDGWSWWYYASAAYGPVLELRFISADNTDPGGAGHVDITVDTAEVSPAITTGTTEQVTSASTCIYFGNDPTDGTSFYDNTGSVTLAGVLAAINAEAEMTAGSDTATTWVLTRVRVEIGWVGSARTCYIDDIEIAGITYDLEGTVADYTTIQAAIDAASDNDTITVQAGIYVEDLEIPVGTDNLELSGVSGATIKGVDIGAGFENFDIMIKASGAKIHGFTIQGPDPESGKNTCGMVIGTPDVEIYNNAFEGTNASANNEVSQVIQTWDETMGTDWDPAGASGIAVIDVDGLSIHDNTFTGRGTGTLGYEGIYINTDNAVGSGSISIADNDFTGEVWRGITVERSDATISGNSIITDWVPGVTWGVGVGKGWAGININDAQGETQDAVTVTGNTIKGSGTGKGFREGIRLGRSTQTLTNISVTNNTVQMNTLGIKVWGASGSAADGVVVTNNNIDGNITQGILNEDTANTLDAENNWWGNASGANYTSAAYDIAYGDIVSDDVDYEPWLLAVVETGVTPTTYDKTLALKDDWTLVSPDKEVTTGTAWVGTTVLSGTDTILAYKYTPGTGFPQVTLATQLTSVDAYYIKTDGGGGVGINYSTSSPGVVTKTLSAGWNVISCAAETDAYALLSQLRTVQIGEQEGVGLTSLVGQASYNQYLAATLGRTLVTSAEWTTLSGTPVTLSAFDGYWVYMNAAKSFGVIPD